MSILRNEGPDDDTLDHNTLDHDKYLLPRPAQVLERCFRLLHLSTLFNLYRGLRVEQPKQAVYKSLPIAIFGLFAAHMVPVFAAMTLVILNFHGYYIGGELAGPSGHDDVKLSGLQFAAKLHELTIQSSISVIVVGLVRQELVAGDGIPFGAVFGSLQFVNFSYLYSKEFFGTLQARFAQPLVKLRLVTLLVIGTFLALTVGPSSAIIMRPRVDNWPAGGTDFYLNASVKEIWPSSVDASSIPTSCDNITLDTNCIAMGWKSALDQLLTYWPRMTDRATMPETLQMNSPESIRLMYTRQTKGLYPFSETLATTQMSTLADSLAEVGRLWNIAAYGLSNVSPRQHRKFMYRSDVIYSLSDVYQPMTAAVCFAQRNSPQLQETLLSKNTIEVPIAGSLCDEERTGAPYLIQPGQSAIISDFVGDNGTFPNLQFVELPPESFGTNTIGALITFPPTWPSGSNLLTCAVDTRWVPVTLQSTRSAMKVVKGAPAGWPGNGLCDPGLRSVNVTAEWAQYLNPLIQGMDKTVFEALVEGAGVQTSGWKNDSASVEGVVETILTTLVTNGLSLSASSATIQGQLNSCPKDNCNDTCGLWCLDMMPRSSQEFGYGRNIYNLSGLPDASKLSRFTVHVDVTGYAYGMRGVTVFLSCAVLLTYCFLATLHTFFVLKTKIVSNAWDTVSEVTALAMQSRPTDVLKNTSAGISSTVIFKNFVKVVEAREGGNGLELDFGDQDHTYGKPLEKGRYYG